MPAPGVWWFGSLFLIAGSAIVAWIDFQRSYIPNIAVLLLWLPGLIWISVTGYGMLGLGWMPVVFGMIVAAMFLLPGYLLNMVGGGDVKYAMVLGFYIGPMGVLFMLALGAPLWGVQYYCQSRRADSEHLALPMGPALTVGFWASLLLLWAPWR